MASPFRRHSRTLDAPVRTGGGGVGTLGDLLTPDSSPAGDAAGRGWGEAGPGVAGGGAHAVASDPVRSLARPPAPTRSQARAAAKAAGKAAKSDRRARLTAERAAQGPRVPSGGLPGPGGGSAGVVDSPPEYRATTVQVCGLWPWVVGSGTPMIGTPIGRHLHTGATVCFDPLSWFLRAKLISNPSLFMLGLPGLGKSTFVRKLVTGATATGVVPMILGDLKPDYVALVRALGGQVVSIGRGRGYLNPLAVGALGAILPQLKGRPSYDRVAAEVAGRRLAMTSGLVALVRREEITDTEQTILATALRLLDERAADTGDDTPPLLSDLVAVIAEGDPQLRAVTLTDTDADYKAAVRRLHLSLMALMSGPVGEVFSRQTSVPLDLDAPAVCIDLSGIAATDERLTAAVLLACWSDGFGAIEAAHTLADEGLAPQRFFFAVLDELWRVLRAGVGMVDRVDELTRLNRTLGLGQAMITHSLDDLDALASEADRAKARGFVERAGAVVCGGLPARELAALSQIVGFTRVEQDMISSWSAPASLSTSGEALPPPGQGKFLIKIGSRVGIPVHTELVTAERDTDLHNTNTRWQAATITADGAVGDADGFDSGEHLVGVVDVDGTVDAAAVAEVAAVSAAAGITAAMAGAEVQHNPTGADPGDPNPHLTPDPDPDPDPDPQPEPQPEPEPEREPEPEVTVGAGARQAELTPAVPGGSWGAAVWTDPDVTQVVRVRADHTDHPAGVAQPAGISPAALPEPGHDRSADLTQVIAASGPGWAPPAPHGSDGDGGGSGGSAEGGGW